MINLKYITKFRKTRTLYLEFTYLDYAINCKLGIVKKYVPTKPF